MARQGSVSSNHLYEEASWTRGIISELKHRRAALGQILSKVGLNETEISQEGARIPFLKAVRLLEIAAVETNDPIFGLKFGRIWDPRNEGIVGYVGLSSPTVADAIKNMSRYRHISNEALEINIDHLDSKGFVRWSFRQSLGEPIRQYQEAVVASFLHFLRSATQREIAPLRVCFQHSRTENIQEFAQFFRCGVTFGSQENLLQLKIPDIALHLIDSDSRLLQLLKRVATETLQRHPIQGTSLIERVDCEIADRLPKGEAKIDVIANKVGLSQRTLARRLRDDETSFSERLQEVRNTLAHRYLKDSDLSISEIAFLVGYSDVSSFTTAFRRYSGHTPGFLRSRKAREQSLVLRH